MALREFLQDLVSPDPEDKNDWTDAIDRLSSCTGILWYGGSGLDLLPIFGSSFGGMPKEVIGALGSRPLFIYCDRAKGYFKQLQELYDDLDNSYFPGYSRREVQLSVRLGGYQNRRGVKQPVFDVDTDEVIIVKHRTLNREPLDHGQDDPETPEWRGVYGSLNLSADFGSGFETKCIDLLFLNVEVLECWHRLFENYQVKPDVFLTLRTSGKSGSWMNMRDPDGPLMQAVANTGNPTLQPDFWITDRTWHLEQVWDDSYVWLHDKYYQRWQRVFAFGTDASGLPQTFKCQWSLLEKTGNSRDILGGV